MNLETFLKAEKIVKEKSVKEAIDLIPKILILCIKKGLDFSLSNNSKVIDIRNLNTGFSLTGYYDYDLVDYENDYCNTIKNIYQKIKEYKPLT